MTNLNISEQSVTMEKISSNKVMLCECPITSVHLCHWKKTMINGKLGQLITILKTDKDVKESITRMGVSLEIHCVIIKDDVESEDGKVKPHKPLHKKLFSCSAPQAICRKDIPY